jgi:hypothetical protein
MNHIIEKCSKRDKERKKREQSEKEEKKRKKRREKETRFGSTKRPCLRSLKGSYLQTDI